MRPAPAPRYPAAFAEQVAHAERFTAALEALEEAAGPEDPSHVWLLGRAEEVKAYVAEVVRGWTAKELSAEEATAQIEGYVESLHGAIEPWYGRWYAPSCCGPWANARPQSGIQGTAEPCSHRRPCHSYTDTDTVPYGISSASTTEIPARIALSA
ncbi:MAG TPA: hypothetical protein VGI39_24395 [Polyangiaceae bacterium]|jgi:hypothetical protein